MNDLFIFMAKASIVTGVLFSFYALLLQKNSFHYLNRAILLFIIVFSVICPFLDFDFNRNYIFNTNYLWINELDDFSNVESLQNTVVQSEHHFRAKHFVLLVYIVGIIVFFIKSIRQFRAIFRLRKSGLKSVKEDSAVFVYLDNIKNPFSFFKWIFLPKDYDSFHGNSSIIEHEKVHVKQLHSLDLILSEAYCILFWFNPFVFLLQKSLKNIHEFIADNEIIRSKQTSIDQYLRLLVSVTEMKVYSGMTSSFRSLTIKKRIKMITNNKSSRKTGILYLLLVPVIALMIQSFSIGVSNDIPSLPPVKGGEITVKFAYSGINPVTKKQYTHGGIDIKIAEGSSVMSTASGKVIEATDKDGWGKLIVIKHANGYETWYAHLSKINVKKGDTVKKEQEIGLSGNTGHSTAPHLHYEIRKNGERVNPEEYFN